MESHVSAASPRHPSRAGPAKTDSWLSGPGCPHLAADPSCGGFPRVLPFLPTAHSLPTRCPPAHTSCLSSDLCELLLASPDPASSPSNCTSTAGTGVSFGLLATLVANKELTSPVLLRACASSAAHKKKPSPRRRRLSRPCACRVVEQTSSGKPPPQLLASIPSCTCTLLFWSTLAPTRRRTPSPSPSPSPPSSPVVGVEGLLPAVHLFISLPGTPRLDSTQA